VLDLGKKQWYVCFNGSLNYSKKFYIQYCSTKKEAEKLLKDIRQLDYEKIRHYTTYLDFVWKSDIKNNVPFNQLHGKLYIKTDNLFEILNK
jgi:hypothetical protein